MGGPTAPSDVLFDELGTDTINLRLLWKDYIVTRDHQVMRVRSQIHSY